MPQSYISALHKKLTEFVLKGQFGFTTNAPTWGAGDVRWEESRGE